MGPELRCICSVASTALLSGFTFENAQMTVPLVLDSAGIVNVSFGFDPLSELSAACAVATRGGLLSTVGITSCGALRCESVIEPSEFGHMITIGVLAICEPKPLRNKENRA